MSKSPRKEKWIRDPVFFCVEKINMGKSKQMERLSSTYWPCFLELFCSSIYLLPEFQLREKSMDLVGAKADS